MGKLKAALGLINTSNNATVQISSSQEQGSKELLYPDNHYGHEFSVFTRHLHTQLIHCIPLFTQCQLYDGHQSNILVSSQSRDQC